VIVVSRLFKIGQEQDCHRHLLNISRADGVRQLLANGLKANADRKRPVRNDEPSLGYRAFLSISYHEPGNDLGQPSAHRAGGPGVEDLTIVVLAHELAHAYSCGEDKDGNSLGPTCISWKAWRSSIPCW
jgi:hypothetical protein